MTKSQSQTAFNTASGDTATAAGNAQTTFNTAQQDIGNYEADAAKVAAANPFGNGGAYQTAQNQQLASTAAAGSQQAQQAAQSAAVRSGINPTSSIAAGTAASEANTRQQLADVGQANQSRLTQDANYNQDVLKADAVPASMETQLNSQELGAQSNTLGDEQKASETPSFWQQLGQGVIQAGVGAAGQYAKTCWIAARLFGGWNAREVAVLRLWFAHQVSRRLTGRFLLWCYRRVGRVVAEKIMPRYPKVENGLQVLFDELWVRALDWTHNTDRGAVILGAYDQVRLCHGYDNDHPAPTDWLDWAVNFAGEGR